MHFPAPILPALLYHIFTQKSRKKYPEMQDPLLPSPGKNAAAKDAKGGAEEPQKEKQSEPASQSLSSFFVPSVSSLVLRRPWGVAHLEPGPRCAARFPPSFLRRQELETPVLRAAAAEASWKARAGGLWR